MPVRVRRFRFFVLLLAIVLSTGVASRGEQRATGVVRVDLADEVMGTTFSVTVYDRDPQLAGRAARAALDEAIRLDQLLSNYKTDSEWSAMNRDAGRRPVVVPAELFDLLEACLAYHRKSEGAFDISVGPLMRVWGFYKNEGTLPATGDVERAMAHVGSRYVRLDRSTRTVAFLSSGVELDPGGIGKGYAIDRMATLLRARGVTRAFLSAGGSTIHGLGTPPHEPRGWPVPIRDPRAPTRAAADVFLRDMSLSTSGSYEKFFRAGGQSYSHIMDPRTGHPARGVSSVSVIARSAIDSEAWTKAYFVNGRAWTSRHLEPDTRVLLCDDNESADCRWVE